MKTIATIAPLLAVAALAAAGCGGAHANQPAPSATTVYRTQTVVQPLTFNQVWTACYEAGKSTAVSSDQPLVALSDLNAHCVKVAAAATAAAPSP